MKNKEHLETDYILALLKPNSRKIFNEIILAKKNKMWATMIVFSITILDNVLLDDDYINLIDVFEKNKIKLSKDIMWLRTKRNAILHYNDLYEKELPFIINDEDLKQYSERAYYILVKNLLKLFPKKHTLIKNKV